MLSRQEYFDTMLSSGFSEDLQSGIAGLELSEEVRCLISACVWM